MPEDEAELEVFREVFSGHPNEMLGIYLGGGGNKRRIGSYGGNPQAL